MSRSHTLLGAVAIVVVTACTHGSSSPSLAPSPDRVPVGYGTESAAQSGGSVQTASASDLSRDGTSRVEELFDGRFPGVHVLRGSNGGLVISVRGGAPSADRQPLYVIDGQPVEVMPARGLDWLTPADIERITVLRNPAETAMYGGRGANGVILITTKSQRR